jgi:hypothetical protein
VPSGPIRSICKSEETLTLFEGALIPTNGRPNTYANTRLEKIHLMAGLMATHSSHLGYQYLNQASLKEKYTVQELGLQRDSDVEFVDGVHQGCNQHIPCRQLR